MVNYGPGDIIRFTYNHKLVEEDTGARFKEVLVLAPLHEGKVHALDLKRMTGAQREVIEAIMDPKFQGIRRHRLPLVNDIMRRFKRPVDEIKKPITFYAKFVRPWLRTAGDCYRTYFPERMYNVTVVERTSKKPGGPKGPSGPRGPVGPNPMGGGKPLFKKI